MIRIYQIILLLMVYSIWFGVLAMMPFTQGAATRSPSTTAVIYTFLFPWFLLCQCTMHWVIKRDEKTIQNHQKTTLYKNLEKPAKLALRASWVAFGLITVYILIFKVLPAVF